MSICPEWFVEAKNAGDSDELLREKTRSFCVDALKYKAQQEGTNAANITDADEEWVSQLIEMYETAYRVMEA